MTTELEIRREEQPAELVLEALIRELDQNEWHVLPEQPLRQCQAHAELVTPRLIAVIEEATRLGREGKVRPGSAHVYALLLLTEFQARQALPALLEAMSLPDPILDELYDDLITEVFSRTLAVLADDQPDLIESMVASRSLNEYVRWAAASSLCMLVRDGKLSRADAIERLVRPLRVAMEARDEWGVSITVSELGDLNPLEVQDEIKSAFEQGLVDESLMDWDYFKSDLLHPDKPGEAPDLPRQRPSAIPDTVEELRQWSCFSEKPATVAEEFVEPLFPTSLDALNETDEDWERPVMEAQSIRSAGRRVGRNDPCPCGSGKKYKKCCLKAGERSS